MDDQVVRKQPFDLFTAGVISIYVIVLALNFRGYHLSEPYAHRLIPLGLGLGALAYISLVLSKKPTVIYIASVVGPLAILRFWYLTDFRLFVGIASVPVLIVLIYSIATKLKPWRRMLPALIASGIVIFMIIFLSISEYIVGFGNDRVIRRTVLYTLSSPNRTWQARAFDNDLDFGSSGLFDIKVNRKYFYGIFEREREIYTGAPLPESRIKWLDKRTLSIDGDKVDVIKDPGIFYTWE